MGSSKRYILITFVLVLYFFFLYSEYSHLFFEPEWKEDIGSIEAYFCPQDACEEVFLKEIKKAKEISCAFYELKLENLTKALEEKSAKVIVHDEKRNTRGLMHNKFCVFDKQRVITGSMNPTLNGVNKNDNNLVVIDSTLLAQNYLAEFEELAGHPEELVKYPKINLSGILIKNYFCPEDTCEQHILEELSKAQEEILFMTFSFTSDPIGDILVTKHNQGVIVEGIMEKRMKNKWWEYDTFKEAGINVILDANPQTMHHKVFIIDKQTVITGSMNPTNNGNRNNDENILIITDEYLVKEFLLAYNVTKNRFSDT